MRDAGIGIDAIVHHFAQLDVMRPGGGTFVARYMVYRTGGLAKTTGIAIM